jgi:hypothetical protein
MLAIGVQPGVEQRLAFRMLDQKHRDRHGDIALAAFHQVGKLAGHGAAGEGVELDGHQRFSILLNRHPDFRAVRARIALSNVLGNGKSRSVYGP